MNQLGIPVAIQKVRVRDAAVRLLMPQIIQNRCFEISDLRLNCVKKQIIDSTQLKRNGNYRRAMEIFKIDNFLLSDILNTNRKN
jgi:hypothetical protein